MAGSDVPGANAETSSGQVFRGAANAPKVSDAGYKHRAMGGAPVGMMNRRCHGSAGGVGSRGQRSGGRLRGQCDPPPAPNERAVRSISAAATRGRQLWPQQPDGGGGDRLATPALARQRIDPRLRLLGASRLVAELASASTAITISGRSITVVIRRALSRTTEKGRQCRSGTPPGSVRSANPRRLPASAQTPHRAARVEAQDVMAGRTLVRA